MNDQLQSATKPQGNRSWKDIVVRYQDPAVGRSLWQVANTLIPYAVLWYLMYRSLAISFWLTLPLMILAAGFMVRIFIIFHDCGHGSFFKSRKANEAMGFFTGVLTFTPYYQWWHEHAIHHATSGDLDRRGVGDIWTLTVQEYLESSRWKRFAYRLARNPIVLFVIAPSFLFLIKHRIPTFKDRRDVASVLLTNLAMIAIGVGMSAMIGWKAYLLIQLPVMMIGATAGVWMFYVQHQFEGGYWQRRDQWDYATAALKGSSFYNLPRVLQWFTGNIGFHHIHHLSPSIPNYNLEKCHKADPLFQSVQRVTLLSSMKSFTFRLWDERRQKFVGYAYLRALRRAGTSST